MKVRSVAIYGGVGKGPQIDALRRGAAIVVACPGRLLDLMGEGHIDLSQVEVFVLDEADRMCDMGFLPDVRRIVKQLPARRQSLFFSATMPRDARQLANTILRSPVTVQIGMTAPAKTVSHALYPVHQRLKKKLLLALLDQVATGRVLVFTRTKYRARNLARDLEIMSGVYYLEEQGEFKTISTYAMVSSMEPYSFKPGEGLTGQVSRNQQILVLTRLPEGHLEVYSGLGKAAPSYLAIVPLVRQGKTVAILECSGYRYEPGEIENMFRILARDLMDKLSPNFS